MVLGEGEHSIYQLYHLDQKSPVQYAWFEVFLGLVFDAHKLSWSYFLIYNKTLVDYVLHTYNLLLITHLSSLPFIQVNPTP